jgi:hypothetical protein
MRSKQLIDLPAAPGILERADGSLDAILPRYP